MTCRSKFNERRMKIVDQKGIDQLEELKVKCPCGHSLILTVQQDTTICSYCGRKVANTTKAHFKYKLRKELNKLKK